MESQKNDYKISFFKPTTRHAKIDRNMVLIFLFVWALAVFGFQFALRFLEKPTPEKALVQFEEVWNNVQTNKANTAEFQQFAHSILTCLGKQSLTAKDRDILQNALTFTSYQLYPDSLREELILEIKNFALLKNEISTLTDPKYIAAKQKITSMLAPVLGVQNRTIQKELLALELSTDAKEFKSTNEVHEVMKLYMIHNQSSLTDTRFLGFPFHYFYTAVFLLVLFVFLCWLYCVIIDKVNIKLGLEE